ncbi:hypothetical protein BSL78_14979 [Apostichopus japonicus]|uniref:Uncharacterized protein n=1 Tax=Stichopus japonicus TaxID=307972 RepID=A0A2G8KJG7_STIJA|nr:hypothetical protein BSL78_14979 [Apostichopus japonicus]
MDPVDLKQSQKSFRQNRFFPHRSALHMFDLSYTRESNNDLDVDEKISPRYPNSKFNLKQYVWQRRITWKGEASTASKPRSWKNTGDVKKAEDIIKHERQGNKSVTCSDRRKGFHIHRSGEVGTRKSRHHDCLKPKEILPPLQRFAILERSALCKVDSKKHVVPVVRRSGGDQRHESISFAVDTSKISERIISGCRKFQDSSKETRNVKVSISYPPSEVKTNRSQSAKAKQQYVSSSSSRTAEIEKDFPDKEKRVPSISSSSSLTSSCEIKGEKAVVYKRASQKNDSTATLPDDYVVPCQVLIPIPGNKSPCSTLEELGKRNAILLASSARRPKFCSYLVDSLLQESESKSSSSQKSTGLGNPVLQEHQDIGRVDEATLSQVTGKRTVMDKPDASSNGALGEEQGVHPFDALEMA